MSKVELLRERVRPNAWKHPVHRTVALTHALPFFRSTQGTYVHRVRSGANHFWEEGWHHTHFNMWCGQSGFISAKKKDRGGELMAALPEHAILCATCEGRAIGSGLLGAPVINGRPVCYSPNRPIVKTI